MKEFIDDFKGIEYRLVDVDNNKKVIRSRPLSIAKQFEMKKLLTDKKIDTREIICRQMAMIFGGKSKDYYVYSAELLNNVLIDWTKEKTGVDPTQAKQPKTLPEK